MQTSDRQQIENSLEELRRIAESGTTSPKLRDMILDVVKCATEDLAKAKAARN